jgi:hypothetical protein
LDSGNNLALRDCINNADGFLSAIVTSRKMSGTIDPEMTTVAAKDWFGIWKNSTNQSMIIGNIGASATNIIKFIMPKLRFKKVNDADRNGIAVAEIQYDLEETVADDEISLYFL